MITFICDKCGAACEGVEPVSGEYPQMWDLCGNCYGAWRQLGDDAEEQLLKKRLDFLHSEESK